MAIDPHGLLAAALSVRVTADTTGLDAEIASKLTAAERRALLTSERVSAATGRVTEVGIASSAKLEVATLRQTAAQESYNRLLRTGESDTIRLARAQASLIAAQAGVRREQARLTETTAARGDLATAGLLGSTRTLLGAAAGIGIFTALKRGVTAYEQLTGSVRSFQRATGAAAPDASRMVAIFQRYGLDGDRATQAILRFGKNIDEQPKKLQKFGVEIARNSDGTVNLSKTLLNANDAFHRTPDAAARAALALSLFGRGGQNLLPVLAANRDTLKGFMDQAQRSGVVFSQKDLDRARELAMSQKDLTQAWQGFEILLARGIVPALHDVDRVGTTVMNLFTDHRTIGTAVLRVGEVAAGLYAINRALKSFDAVRNSTLFTKLFNVGETQAQAAANIELAGSYRAIGAAAASAIPEVAALDTAEAAGMGAGVLGDMRLLRATIPSAGILGRLGVTGGGGLLGALALRAGPVARAAAIGASAIDPVILASLLAGGDQTPKNVKAANATENQLLGQFSYSHGAFYAGNQKVTDQRLITLLRDQGLGPALNGQEANAAMRFYPRLFKGSSASVVGAQNQALGAFLAGATPDQIQAASHAQGIAAATQAGQQYASGVDIFARAPSLTPQAAAGSSQALDNARTRAADAARRVTLDEERLNALRNGKTKPTALALASAEETLRLAKERSAQASRAVQTAEGKTTAARLPTARSLLSTTTSQANRAALDAKAVERLYGVGLRKDVVDKIIAQNATTPGALESIAKTTTPKLARALEQQFRQIRLNGSIIAGTPQQWETAGSQRALDFMRGVENVFNQAAPAVVRARVAGVQRKIDAGMPVTSRTRQRALSGSPSLPHGA